MITIEEILTSEILALSWKQPYATLMLHGKEETRTWYTKYRGLVLICASKKPYTWDELTEISGKRQLVRILETLLPQKTVELAQQALPLIAGKAIAVGRLVDCQPMNGQSEIFSFSSKIIPESHSEEDRCFVKYQRGLYRHIYKDVAAIEPFDWKGAQGWRKVSEEVKTQIKLLSVA